MGGLGTHMFFWALYELIMILKPVVLSTVIGQTFAGNMRVNFNWCPGGSRISFAENFTTLGELLRCIVTESVED